jgi:hypothetical protein
MLARPAFVGLVIVALAGCRADNHTVATPTTTSRAISEVPYSLPAGHDRVTYSWKADTSAVAVATDPAPEPGGSYELGERDDAMASSPNSSTSLSTGSENGAEADD